MAKYVPDVKSQRWVIITPSRIRRPGEGKIKTAVCPFCYGNEKVSGTEVYRLGPGEPNTPDWKVRVISNKYPITDYHEVIIHSPDHKKDWDELALDKVEDILKVYRQRFNFHRENGHVLIFCNHGSEAGASIEHPHSQLVVVPKQINLDVLAREPIANIVRENGDFIVFCPDFSQWPYEVWIAPKKTGKFFGDLEDTELSDLADVLQKTIQVLAKYVCVESPYFHEGVPFIPSEREFSYNFYIYPDCDWYLRIIPRLIHRAGFELGTGLNVNIVDPADVAIVLTGENK